MTLWNVLQFDVIPLWIGAGVAIAFPALVDVGFGTVGFEGHMYRPTAMSNEQGVDMLIGDVVGFAMAVVSVVLVD